MRFVLSRQGRAAGRHGSCGLRDPNRVQEIEVGFEPDGSVRLQADGMLAIVLAYFAEHAAGTQTQWISPVGTARIDCSDHAGGRLAAQLVLAASVWWRLADFPSVFPILAWSVTAVTAVYARQVDAHPLALSIDRESVRAYVLESCLKELHRLARIYGEDPGAEEEVAGWCREIEATIRQSAASFGGVHLSSANHKPTSPNWPKGKFRRSLIDGSKYYVAEEINDELESVDRQLQRSRASIERLRTLADGERSLAEIALRLAVEFGLDWESAVNITSRWVREGLLGALDRTLPSRTLLYFSYGSCMCRPSFRETIPRFELIGEAILKEYRLGFTHRSVVRAGGVADVVPMQESEVRGILYRIPRVYLGDLDEREGVSTGHYRREFVVVEALGVRYENVLTYTVVNKSPRDIPPSPEYAGLIADGARGLLSHEYVAGLDAIFESLGVEPEFPL